MVSKRIILGTILLLLIAAGSYAYLKTKPAPPTNNSDNSTKTFDPRNPNFVMAEIASMNPYQLTFDTSDGTYTAQIAVQTRLVRQAKGATSSASTIDAQPSEFKKGKKVLIFFSSPPKDKVYLADKIQLID